MIKMCYVHNFVRHAVYPELLRRNAGLWVAYMYVNEISIVQLIGFCLRVIVCYVDFWQVDERIIFLIYSEQSVDFHNDQCLLTYTD